MSGKLAGYIIIWFEIIKIFCVFQIKSELQVGPWGGQGGDMWTYEPKGDINNITVTYDHFVHSICFTSIDQNGNLDESEVSCTEAAKTAQIIVDVKTEKINGISGTFENTKTCSKTITSLSFTTNSNKTYGPFGTVKGTAFSLVVKEGIDGFYGSSGWLLDSIGVSSSTLASGTTVDVGPWGGGENHKKYDYKATGFISRIAISWEGGIHSLIFTSEDENGVTNTSQMIGGGAAQEEVVLDVKNGERLIGISGTIGDYLGLVIIQSIKFYSSKGRTFGPFDEDIGKPFSYIGENSYISGIFGRDGSWVESIGIHVQVLNVPSLTFGEWGNTNAGNTWTYEPEEGISHISISHGIAINSINFTSTVGNSNTVGLPKFGKGIIGIEKISEIDINPKNEKLSGISGTFGAIKGWEVITSLTFVTNNNRTFGPFGTEMGTAFSVPLTDGFISGFHGRSDKWLECIGIYVKAT